jgi:hypothetical protein
MVRLSNTSSIMKYVSPNITHSPGNVMYVNHNLGSSPDVISVQFYSTDGGSEGWIEFESYNNRGIYYGYQQNSFSTGNTAIFYMANNEMGNGKQFRFICLKV